MDLPTLIDLIAKAWPDRYERGRVTHVHKNAIRLPDGSAIHLRVLIQTLEEAEVVECPESVSLS